MPPFVGIIAGFILSTGNGCNGTGHSNTGSGRTNTGFLFSDDISNLVLNNVESVEFRNRCHFRAL